MKKYIYLLLCWSTLIASGVCGPISPLDQGARADVATEPSFADGEAISQFLSSNYVSLASDISKGKGQFLDAFADLVGVNEKEHDLFVDILKKQFVHIYPNLEVKPQDFINRVIQVLSEHQISVKHTEPLAHPQALPAASTSPSP